MSDLRPVLVARIAALPKEERDILALVHYEELTIDEVAEVLEITRTEALIAYEVAKSHITCSEPA